jgi:hypothetical protein
MLSTSVVLYYQSAGKVFLFDIKERKVGGVLMFSDEIRV